MWETVLAFKLISGRKRDGTERISPTAENTFCVGSGRLRVVHVELRRPRDAVNVAALAEGRRPLRIIYTTHDSRRATHGGEAGGGSDVNPADVARDILFMSFNIGRGAGPRGPAARSGSLERYLATVNGINDASLSFRAAQRIVPAALTATSSDCYIWHPASAAGCLTANAYR